MPWRRPRTVTRVGRGGGIILSSLGEKGGEREGFAAITTDPILDFKETRVYPRDEEAIDGQHELYLTAGD